MLGPVGSGRFGGILELIIGERRSIPDAERVPVAAIEAHQREQQARIQAAAEQQSERNVADEMPLHRRLVELDQFFRRLLRAGLRGEWHRGELVVARDVHLAVFDDEFFTRGELLDALEHRARGRRVAIAQKKSDGFGINARRLAEGNADRPDLRTKSERSVADCVVDRLDAHRIARQQQPALFHVPDGEAEHAVEAVQHGVTPLLIAVHDHLGVAVGTKHVAVPLQLLLELLIVVDLPVEDHPHRLGLVGHRLVAGG